MNYLSVERLSKSYLEQPLFIDLTFGIKQGQKVALVGKNGSGKSTLMKIIAGAEMPDTGKVILRKGVRVGYLRQNPEFSRHVSIRDYIFDQENEVLSIIKEYEALVETKAFDDTKNDYQRVLNKMDSHSAWDYEAQIKQILGKLGIHDLDGFTDELSGGQKKRVALAAVLVGNPDFLVLDEPTNHLDIEAIEWLENYLSAQSTSLLLVTHDRYFLEEVTNEILEIDDKTIYSYNGNYSYYLEKKNERKAQEASEVAKAKNLLVKELEWLRRMPKARGSKAKYRIDAAHELMEVANRDLGEESLTLKIRSKRQGKKILELHHISKFYGNNAYIADFTYHFKRKDRIGIVGKNGVGKTTFLEVITKNIEPDTGEVIHGDTIQFGYYTQEGLPWQKGMKVIDVVKEVAEVVTLSDGATISAAQFLNHFLFPHSMHHTPVEKLSGGERRRLQLLRVLIKAPNFLILDEPTNDLDILTMNVLEDYLANFDGSLIIVSHDRYFMDKLSDHLFVFRGEGKIIDFPGNYSDYKIDKDQSANTEEKEASKSKKGKSVKSEQKTKLSYKETIEFNALESEIADLEKRKNEVLKKMHDGSGDHEMLFEWSKEIENLNSEIAQKENRWLELSEFAE
jgi:ATP-binding cassette subfamily F protein uup